MTDLTDKEINKMVEHYKKQRERDRKRYLRRKENPEFMEKNRQRARAHYQANKEAKKLKYENNKDFVIARSHYYYYKNNNRVNEFIDKFPDKVKILENYGLVIGSGSGSGSTTSTDNSSSSV